MAAGMEMFLDDAGRVMHRHGVAGKRHHARAERQMQIVQRGALKGGIGGTDSHWILGQMSANEAFARPMPRESLKPPLSCDLRVFPCSAQSGSRKVASVGGFSAMAENLFPERHPPAVHGPERFRGGCAFGAGSSIREPNSSAGIFSTPTRYRPLAAKCQWCIAIITGSAAHFWGICAPSRGSEKPAFSWLRVAFGPSRQGFSGPSSMPTLIV